MQYILEHNALVLHTEILKLNRWYKHCNDEKLQIKFMIKNQCYSDNNLY